MTNVNEQSLIGGKRKNGHKMDCTCHICQNMKNKAKRNGYEEDIERDNERKMGKQKINGHKKNCDCPICRNMIHSKSKKHLTGGKRKKSNGHKPTCNCPICKNMKKKGGDPNKEDTTNKKDTTTEKGTTNEEGTTTEAADDDYPSNEKLLGGKSKKRRKSNGHKPACNCPICKNMKKTRKNNSKKYH